MRRLKFLAVLAIGSLVIFTSCSKNSSSSADPYYTPTAANVTSTATLTELQQGRDLYLGRCGACHGIYSPDSYSAANWRSILSIMGPRAGLSAANITLVTKYVTRGQ